MELWRVLQINDEMLKIYARFDMLIDPQEPNITFG